MSNNYCRKLSNSAHLTFEDNKIKFQPCCWVPPYNNNIQNKIQLDFTRKIFIQKITKNKEQYCKECLNREEFEYGGSDRQRIKYFIPEDAEDNEIYDITLQIDTTCNAACVMCGPHFSSLWAKQIDPNFKLTDYSNQYKKISNFDNWKNLTKVLIAGGEPLLSIHNFEFLKNIPNPENVTLSVSTNGSILIDDDIKSIFKRFKKVILNYSIDGLDEIFEYIRWPLTWNKVSNNIHNYITSNLEEKNFWGANITVNPMNILYVDDIINYFNKTYNNHLNSKFKIFTSVCYGTWGLDATPQKLRQYVEEKFGRDNAMVKMLRSQPEVPGKFNKLIENMEYLDNARNLSHKDTFREVFKILG